MAWLPLESNPDVMNQYMQKLGIPEKWKMVDVYGLDGDALNWVPRPVLAVILLFPCSDQYYKFAEEQCEKLKESGQAISDNLFYMKQIVSNACGTIALVHSIANNRSQIQLGDGPLKQLLEDCAKLSPQERGELLQGADHIVNMHKELSLEGQTEADPEVPVNHHFVAFVHKDGNLYELDGRKEFPINHGPTTADSLLEDAAKVCKGFIERDSDDVRFTVVALTTAD